MTEPRYDVHCQGCGKFLWSQPVPTRALVTSGCCLPKHTAIDGLNDPVPITATNAAGEDVVVGVVMPGSTMENNGAKPFMPQYGWHKRSCPWPDCDAMTLWKGLTAPPIHCAQCGRGLERNCPVCKAQVWRAPLDATHCGQPLVSAEPLPPHDLIAASAAA